MEKVDVAVDLEKKILNMDGEDLILDDRLVFVGVGKLILERDSDQIIMRTLKLYYADPNEDYEFINEEGGRIAEYLNEIRLLSPPFNFISDDKGLPVFGWSRG